MASVNKISDDFRHNAVHKVGHKRVKREDIVIPAPLALEDKFVNELEKTKAALKIACERLGVDIVAIRALITEQERILAEHIAKAKVALAKLNEDIAKGGGGGAVEIEQLETDIATAKSDLVNATAEIAKIDKALRDKIEILKTRIDNIGDGSGPGVAFDSSELEETIDTVKAELKAHTDDLKVKLDAAQKSIADHETRITNHANSTKEKIKKLTTKSELTMVNEDLQDTKQSLTNIHKSLIGRIKTVSDKLTPGGADLDTTITDKVKEKVDESIDVVLKEKLDELNLGDFDAKLTKANDRISAMQEQLVQMLLTVQEEIKFVSGSDVIKPEDKTILSDDLKDLEDKIIARLISLTNDSKTELKAELKLVKSQISKLAPGAITELSHDDVIEFHCNEDSRWRIADHPYWDDFNIANEFFAPHDGYITHINVFSHLRGIYVEPRAHLQLIFQLGERQIPIYVEPTAVTEPLETYLPKIIKFIKFPTPISFKRNEKMFILATTTWSALFKVSIHFHCRFEFAK